MDQMTRREALGMLITGSLTGALISFTKGGKAMAEDIQQSGSSSLQLAPAYRGAHQVKPLPFDPTKLKGLSEKLITSHHQNNYGGAVRRLNQIQPQIGSLPKDAAPYQMGSLKREELIATNSMILHEFYFGNLGGDGKASGTIVDVIKAHYGTFEAWEHDFRLSGLSLAGGSGWVIMSYNPRDNAVHNYWAWDHTHSLAWGAPLLVMDMYEHSYHLDYGANARGYIDAFFQNINWDEVNRRAEAARPRK
ncbi:MAG: superoxide dismutase [Acidobacteria bacterium]|nr:superoxide dismutase [Acidobacteriota bacterium]